MLGYVFTFLFWIVHAVGVVMTSVMVYCAYLYISSPTVRSRVKQAVTLATALAATGPPKGDAPGLKEFMSKMEAAKFRMDAPPKKQE